MTYTLNPNAKEFIPSMTHSKTEDFVINPIHAELLAKRALEKQIEAQIKKIPTITSIDGLEQVAQISYHHQTGQDTYELYCNGQHAILDNRRCSWQFPNISIRDIIHFHFDGNFVLKDDPALDQLASSVPTILVDITPVYEEENTWHRWKQIP
jgi:hypothetical protein